MFYNKNFYLDFSIDSRRHPESILNNSLSIIKETLFNTEKVNEKQNMKIQSLRHFSEIIRSDTFS